MLKKLYMFFLSLLMIMSFLMLYQFFFDFEMLKMLMPILPILLLMALFTLLESKMLASMQSSSGPNIVGMFGLFQPMADAMKLILKETIMPGLSNMILFMLAPMNLFCLSLLNWVMMPFDYGMLLADMNMGLLFLFAMSSLGVYGIMMSGWASNSKYAYLGSLSTAAQFISYEVSMGMMSMVILLNMNSLNMTEMMLFQKKIWLMFPLFFSFILFFMAALAETNSIPYDLPEAESELVSGYNVEYSAMTFVLFFLAEYSNMLMMSMLIVMFFLGGWYSMLNFFLSNWIIMMIKMCLIIYLFILISATLPSYSYDQLMNMGWKILLMLSMKFLMLYSIFMYLMS